MSTDLMSDMLFLDVVDDEFGVGKRCLTIALKSWGPWIITSAGSGLVIALSMREGMEDDVGESGTAVSRGSQKWIQFHLLVAAVMLFCPC